MDGLSAHPKEPDVFPKPHSQSSPSFVLPHFRNVSLNCLHAIKHNVKSQA